MKSLVLYESEYGNTQKIAIAIAEALGKHGDARVTPASSIADLGAEGSFDVLAVGAPTQRHHMPAAVKELLEDTPRGKLANVRALAFDTRYRRSRWITGTAAREIGKHLRRMGCKMLAEPESFFVVGEGDRWNQERRIAPGRGPQDRWGGPSEPRQPDRIRGHENKAALAVVLSAGAPS